MACSSCHQSPETGGISQINEFRAGHLNSSGVFVNPPGGQSLIQLRAIAAPIRERLDNAPLENIRTFRTSLNTMGDERIRPFSDFLLHNIGTGDGIVQNGGAATRNMVRTPPLWGVRMRPLLMHDGLSFTFNEAIQRHAGQATSSRNAFNALTTAQKNDVIAFLKSL